METFLGFRLMRRKKARRFGEPSRWLSERQQRLSACSLTRRILLNVGKKAHETSFLDGAGKLALILRTGAGDGTGKNLAIGTDESAEQLGIFVIDVFDVILGEIAGLPAGTHLAEWHFLISFLRELEGEIVLDDVDGVQILILGLGIHLRSGLG